jgi:hypothetical protein
VIRSSRNVTPVVRRRGRPEPEQAGHRVRVRPGAVLAAAARAGRRFWKQILALAIPVTVVSAGLEILIDHFADPHHPLVSVSASLTATFISLLGTILLSGFVCRLAGTAEHGWGPVRFGRVVRTLPWLALVEADIVVTVIVIIGLLLLVVPALIALTFLAIVGPVIEIEQRRVWDAIRRSVRLVRQHVWTVVLLATVPIAAAAQLEAVAPEPHTAGDIAQFLVIRGVAEGIVEACIALVLAELCFQLIDAERRAAAASAPGQARGEAAADKVADGADGVAESRRRDRRVPDDEA